MTSNHHDPHNFGDPLDSAILNDPLGELDSALSVAIASGFVDAATTLDAQATSGQKVLPVTSTVGFIVGDSVWVGTPGSGLQESGVVDSISAGVSLTLEDNLANTHAIGSPVSRSPAEIVNARGTHVTLGTRLDFLDAHVFNVKAYGAVGDGVADDTTAVQAAQSAAGTTGVVFFPGGTYLITDTLSVPDAYSWVGARSERGTNAQGATYYATTILFDPVDTTKWLVQPFQTTDPGEMIGPFEHRNLRFNIGDANGLRFGREDVDSDGDSDPVTDGAGQRYVFGVRFGDCAIHATAADRVSVAGVITRSGRTLIHLTKCFESSLQDVSLFGGDTQVRTWGCDKPVFRGVRSQGSHLPFDFNASGTFAVQHIIDDLQVEGWTFTPIRNEGVQLSVSNTRLEQNDGTPTGSGLFVMAQSVTVTADSSTLTFSASVAGILFPGLSVIRVHATAAIVDCLVTAVSGVTVTVSAATVFTAAEAGVTVTRIHGYGPIHNSVYDATLTNVGADASTDTPCFVYVANRGNMTITGAVAQAGTHTGIGSRVIGNTYLSGDVGFLNHLMSFHGCTPVVIAPIDHPFVYVSDYRSGYGDNEHQGNYRSKVGSAFEDMLIARRAWAFSPKSIINSDNNAHLHPFLELAGDTNTEQKVWAWHKRVGSNELTMADRTLPAVTGSFIRIQIRARSVAATGTLTYNFQGNGGGAGIDITTLTDSWQTFTSVRATPAQWLGARANVPCVRFTGDSYYLAAVTVEELPGDPTITGSRGGNAALADLLTTLAAAGLIIDSSS